MRVGSLLRAQQSKPPYQEPHAGFKYTTVSRRTRTSLGLLEVEALEDDIMAAAALAAGCISLLRTGPAAIRHLTAAGGGQRLCGAALTA